MEKIQRSLNYIQTNEKSTEAVNEQNYGQEVQMLKGSDVYTHLKT